MIVQICRKVSSFDGLFVLLSPFQTIVSAFDSFNLSRSNTGRGELRFARSTIHLKFFARKCYLIGGRMFRWESETSESGRRDRLSLFSFVVVYVLHRSPLSKNYYPTSAMPSTRSNCRALSSRKLTSRGCYTRLSIPSCSFLIEFHWNSTCRRESGESRVTANYDRNTGMRKVCFRMLFSVSLIVRLRMFAKIHIFRNMIQWKTLVLRILSYFVRLCTSSPRIKIRNLFIIYYSTDMIGKSQFSFSSHNYFTLSLLYNSLVV